MEGTGWEDEIVVAVVVVGGEVGKLVVGAIIRVVAGTEVGADVVEPGVSASVAELEDSKAPLVGEVAAAKVPVGVREVTGWRVEVEGPKAAAVAT